MIIRTPEIRLPNLESLLRERHRPNPGTVNIPRADQAALGIQWVVDAGLITPSLSRTPEVRRILATLLDHQRRGLNPDQYLDVLRNIRGEGITPQDQVVLTTIAAEGMLLVPGRQGSRNFISALERLINRFP